MEYTLITGATSGIGRALAIEFAKRRHHLILASRNTVKMQEYQKEWLAKYGITVVCLTIDLSSPGAPEKLFAACQDKTVSVLVNNSGFGLGAARQTEQDLAETDRLFQLNAGAVLKLSMLFGREMQKRKHGYILNVASTAAFQPLPYAAVYGASKAFVLSLSEAMHMELKDSGVGVTALCPGITDTNFFQYGKPRVPGFLYKLVSPELTARRAVKALYQKKIYLVPYFQHWLIAQISRWLTRRAAASLLHHIEIFRKRVR
ncbi:short-chain dehydrogenase [Candidatus Termititenax persephonae]|uniref:NADP-dependent 3-hydroxy acid dehydrogenase YdfG n=1 Tax=Candidatus Termititenax persephonae TaxID=2218525 RepID=A0A388TF73_9BACT|nr:short-chain dehydrogenase [Candidatus Termititenax persephonae]